MKLFWPVDAATRSAALDFAPPGLPDVPAAQFAGKRLRAGMWSHRVLGSDRSWPPTDITSSPSSIIEQFADGRFLEALALVVSWGSMQRTARFIYGDRELSDIERTLAQSARDIGTTGSVETSWHALTWQGGTLGWSAVTTSKVLHFLCRSLGIDENPPVAVDGKIVLGKVWPAFVRVLGEDHELQGWRGSAFPAYARYMTAITTWAEVRGWTSTQLETTLFETYR